MPTGIAPPDLTTALGQLRGILGDDVYTELDPPVAGMGEYENFSDTELSALLASTDGNVFNSAGFAYLKLASLYASQSVNVQTDDLRLDLSKRANEMRLIASQWFDRGDAASKDGGSDYFDVVPTTLLPVEPVWPEATARGYVF